MHLLVAAALSIFINGTISVHIRNADTGENGVYVQRIHNARATVDRGILQFEAPALFKVSESAPPCTGTFGDPTTPIQGSIFLTHGAQKEFLGTLIAPGQLLGGGSGSSPPCGIGFAGRFPSGRVAPPSLPTRLGSTTHWKFTVRDVPDATPGSDAIEDWTVDLSFAARR
ncbi:MAG: hypothetical protein ACP5O6_04760 [Candidatus Baltobacteraceae bacterium]